MSATVTLTGKCGAGITDTGLDITTDQPVIFDTAKNIIIIDGQSYAIDDATTITATKSGNAYTFVIS